ncbi:MULTISPECIES: sialate O-acetylesterase [unclassified Mucilaginibacter]|uniref:sialate O-acetylesterase n=1 Tax=unclassified Mucilaginibacter TaxID=2617802 RepID=UPI002AC8A811|nr:MULTISPECIES: sialate O-acetylesterase [unclassified Mucilaginibacter]MEB0260358.1 sialate O-acetylesterase [Mucilaginibacter sp. 10I4]MEB0279397.1 sialate O-acetylesterase [Mucilaginibacter sp. 10B2]MEB0300525.1 sialate O-acetylesterase [Mucilaginibacter sp. 5C4]WPX21771.1 sialate O-acetylesterase [Mucilaginibacter sp. 5C4]
MKLFLRLAFFFGCWLTLPAHAAVRLPQLISDGMVLQRGVPLNIWGWADANEQIILTFNKKTYRINSGADGEWKVIFPAMKAGGPYTMDIRASNQITLKDILIGDVWFCSGQSNMVLPMERVKERYPDDIALAKNSQIRNFSITTESDVTKEHQDVLPANWSAATPENVLNFGAATWFFANQLYKKYHVPIGIINSSVGGTPIQAWISTNGLKNITPYNSRVLQTNTRAFQDSILKDQQAAKNKPPAIHNDKGLSEATKWYDPAYIPKSWHQFWLPGYWTDQGIRDLNGVVWFRKEADLPASAANQTAKLLLGRILDADETYVNGKLVGSISYQYPPRRYNIPDGLLKTGKNIIVVRVTNFSGKGGFVPDKPFYLTVGNDTIDLKGSWQYKVGEVFTPEPSANAIPVFSAQNEPAGLFNTIVAPVIQYPVKGILWYQGETNAEAPANYGQLLTALIADWRNKWHLGNLPFIYAQLPNFNDVQYSPAESKWAELREQQLKTLAVPNTRMIVIIDLGEWNDIHPLNKKDVGTRFFLAAQNTAYGDKTTVYSGPIFSSAKVLGDQIELSFNHTGSGLTAKGEDELGEFAIAGIDKKFVWAKAVIKNGKVIIHIDKIQKPTYIRYAWADNPKGANLYNKEGLPASPFEVKLTE